MVTRLDRMEESLNVTDDVPFALCGFFSFREKKNALIPEFRFLLKTRS